MRYIKKSRITEKASRETGALYFLSRRAHLLTTDKVGGVLPAADVRSAKLCVGATRQYLYNRFTREEQVICQMHSGNMRTKNF